MTSRSPRMRALVALLVLLVAFPSSGAQVPAPPALAGTWKGSFRLSNDSPPTTCRYEGGEDAAVVKLQESPEGLRAVVRLEAAGTAGSGCPPLQKRYEATNLVVTGSALSFLDPAGHEWTLGLREGKLVGLVAWKGGGRDEPLAEAFAPPGGAPPLTRLSGEVNLSRAAGEGAGPASPAGVAGTSEADTSAAGEGPKAPTKGSKFWPAFIGANVIGLGAFYGIKKATDDTSSGGVATCSPRYCVYGGVSDPCVCNINIVSGGSCGQTTSGVVFGGVCNDTTLPCQADLSCNNNVCDDRVGRCPF